MQSAASLANLDLNGDAANGASNGDAVAQSALDSVHRTVTGVLTSRPTSRDIKIDGFSMGVNGQELIQDCTIELTIGRRYGLLGQNGCGKTNFLQCLANREVPIPDHMDLYHLCEEAAPTSRTALETVVDYIKDEVNRLTVSILSRHLASISARCYGAHGCAKMKGSDYTSCVLPDDVCIDVMLVAATYSG